MTYLLIALVLAIILSPLLGMRSSPRQKLVADLRRCAVSNGLQIKLSRLAGAREGEGRLDSVLYRLRWLKDTKPSTLRRGEEWLLIRGGHRGDAAPWGEWRWLSLPPALELQAAIGVAVEALTGDITGFEASREGLAVYWRERGESADVKQLAEALKKLQKSIRPTTNLNLKQ